MAAKRKTRKQPPRNWPELFLAELAASSNVSQAARKAHVEPSKVYKFRRTDSGFFRKWQEALAEGYDNLEMDLLLRMRTGELEGGKAKTRATRKFDNAVAFRLLAAHREAVGRHRAQRSFEDEDAVLASLDAKLEQMRQNSLALGEVIRNEDGTYSPPDAQ